MKTIISYYSIIVFLIFLLKNFSLPINIKGKTCKTNADKIPIGIVIGFSTEIHLSLL